MFLILGSINFVFGNFISEESIIPDPPIAQNIEVCEGESTLVTPMGEMSTSSSIIYSETFDTDGEGVAGACSGVAANSCAMNVPPVNGQWSIVGNVSGLTASSDFAITSGGALVFQDTDSE